MFRRIHTRHVFRQTHLLEFEVIHFRHSRPAIKFSWSDVHVFIYCFEVCSYLGLFRDGALTFFYFKDELLCSVLLDAIQTTA